MDADEELTFWCFVSVMDRMVSLAPHGHRVKYSSPTETKLLEGSKWHEEAAVDAAATHQCHGPGALSAPRLVLPLSRRVNNLTPPCREDRLAEPLLLFPVSLRR